ncbi:kinesin motor domain-containing protein [Mycotypha africana]|uniref:kinesin motor domain-containing protein n=1 Tax=Mycotypha africana TaxID=64632 RepID=UPI002300CBEC|nr:kinesin motor domain-containing protein [Mycotypha africana]KAI8971802.1 kinesin motor domain-containing protein [Mycotypha africana]
MISAVSATSSSSSRTVTTTTHTIATEEHSIKSTTLTNNNSNSPRLIRKTNSNRKNAENVKVTVRCRPPNPKEYNHQSCWKVDQELNKITSDIQQQNQHKKQHEFLFDHVFYGSDNEALYSTSVNHLINQAMEGYNVTVFAYGQTASGKTFTMMGNDAEPGVIPRSVDNVFDYIKKSVTREFLLRVSYLEIYNETIRDLLDPANNSLKIHQDKIRGIYVTPLTEEVVTTPEDVLRVIERGEANRHISSTDYNLHSSRSHTLFQMVIESRERTATNNAANVSLKPPKRTFTSMGYGNSLKSKDAIKISQLNLIDLAGSEKAASDENRRKEGSYINKSLLTLGTVISKLTEQQQASHTHIPFRDSKLTRLLQTALTGLAKVAVICTIHPSLQSMEESLNTLKFASRVKKITTHAKNDEILEDENSKALLQKYRTEIAELKSKLESTSNILQKEKEKTQSAIIQERRDHDQQMRQMLNIRNMMKERIDHLTRLILTSSNVDHNHLISSASTAAATSASSLLTNNYLPYLSDSSSSYDNVSHVDSLLITDPSSTGDENCNTNYHHLLSANVSCPSNSAADIMIQDLRRQVERLTIEARQKDQRILSLEEQLRHQISLNSQLETSLSVTKAELEVTNLLAANNEIDNEQRDSMRIMFQRGTMNSLEKQYTLPTQRQPVNTIRKQQTMYSFQ